MCLAIEVNRPDSVLAKGEHAGFQWIITHNTMACRCGYVRVPPEHPLHGRTGNEQLTIHGGITFAESDIPCDADGDDRAWWFGFDCAHSFDAPDESLPGYETLPDVLKHPPFGGKVRTQEYVVGQCKSLCEQLKVLGERWGLSYE